MSIIPFPGPGEKRVCCCGRRKRINRLYLPVSTLKLGQVKFSAPGDCSTALTPAEAVSRLETVLRNGIVPELIELSGPGDPLAETDVALATLEMIHVKHPEIPLAIRTLGIGGEEIVHELVRSGVRQATLLVDTVDPEVGQKIYAWIRPGKKTVPLARGVGILLDEQAKSLRSFSRAGIRVTVKTTVYPGYNDDRIAEVAVHAAGLGAEAMMIVPYKPGKDQTAVPPEPNGEMMDLIHARAAKHIRIVGEQSSPGEGISLDAGKRPPSSLPQPAAARPNVAVVSSSGREVDLHLGQAIRLLVYGPREDGLICLLETREAPEPGGGGSRWNELADILNDCFVLLAAGAGESPKKILRQHGIPVLITEGEIDGTVDVLYGDGIKKRQKKRAE